MESFFNVALPGLDAEKLAEIMLHLKSVGCETYQDLQYMDCDNDLTNLLRPFDVRKVKAKWTSTFHIETPGKI